MIKRIIIIAFSIILSLNISVPRASAMAESAECACVINSLTGDVVLSKNPRKRHAMASTTKIMTALIAIEKCGMEEIVTVSENAANQEGSAAYIRAGSQIYMKDMLYGLMLNSGNDAAEAIAEHVAGSGGDFAALMNEKTMELGLRETHFANPSGLSNPEHFTTAYDLAMITRYAMLNPLFREIVSAKTYRAKPINSEEILYFSNHNRMLEAYDGANGVKTGFTKNSGRCLVSSAKRDGMEFIAVTLGDADDWNDHAQMLDYAFSEHYPKKVIEKGAKVKIAEIDGKKYNMLAAEDFTIPLRKNGKVPVEIISHIADNLYPPINAGEKVGRLEIKCGGEAVGSVDIISASEIENVSGMRLKNSFYSSFENIFKRLLL